MMRATWPKAWRSRSSHGYPGRYWRSRPCFEPGSVDPRPSNIIPRRDMAAKTSVAIIGASGYAARELIRILLNHPHVTITVATSRQDEAPRLDALHPSLARRIDLTCDVFDADRVSDRASLAFLALPHTASMAVTPALRQRGMRIIDLSADYRLTDPRIYADWYGHE